MNDAQPTSDDTSDKRDSEQEGHGEQERRGADSPGDSGSEVGITDDDMEQIRSFLRKQRHRRSVDDLRPSSRR